MRLVDILARNYVTQDIEFNSKGIYYFFEEKGQPWGIEVMHSYGGITMRGGPLGEAWESQKLPKKEINKFNKWCGLYIYLTL